MYVVNSLLFWTSFLLCFWIDFRWEVLYKYLFWSALVRRNWHVKCVSPKSDCGALCDQAIVHLHGVPERTRAHASARELHWHLQEQTRRLHAAVRCRQVQNIGDRQYQKGLRTEKILTKGPHPYGLSHVTSMQVTLICKNWRCECQYFAVLFSNNNCDSGSRLKGQVCYVPRSCLYWVGKPVSGGLFPAQWDEIEKIFGLLFPLEGIYQLLYLFLVCGILLNFIEREMYLESALHTQDGWRTLLNVHNAHWESPDGSIPYAKSLIHMCDCWVR